MRIPVSPFYSSVSSSLLRLLLSDAAPRAFSSAAAAEAPVSLSVSGSLLRRLKNVPSRYRARAFRQAQLALTEYLHMTRALQFCHAEHIAANSPACLLSLLSRLHFPDKPSDLPRVLRRFLAYCPINEFDFFFESIGLPALDAGRTRGHGDGVFLSEDTRLVPAVSALIRFGFPWTKLGVLYAENSSILSKGADDLASVLGWFESLGFDKVAVVGICLAFPGILTVKTNPGDGEIAFLFEDLKRVFSDFHPEGSAEESVEICYLLCRQIRVFYDLGCAKGAVGELLAARRDILLKIEHGDLIRKVEFFGRLDMKKEEVGLFILQCPEVLHLDLDKAVLRMPDYLERIGLSEEGLVSILQEYPYVMGKNKVGNLPNILKAIRLDAWFTQEIRKGKHHYLSPAFLGSDDPDDRVIDLNFFDKLLMELPTSKAPFLKNKLEFLLRIGFGENDLTVKVLKHLNSTQVQLKERFDCLLVLGIDYPVLCRMVSATPKLLNQKPYMLRMKVNHFCNDLGCSLQYLNKFPAYLCFDLEKRIKPRYRILNWLKERGLFNKHYSPATVLATSEKKFIDRRAPPASSAAPPSCGAELLRFLSLRCCSRSRVRPPPPASSAAPPSCCAEHLRFLQPLLLLLRQGAELLRLPWPPPSCCAELLRFLSLRCCSLDREPSSFASSLLRCSESSQSKLCNVQNLKKLMERRPVSASSTSPAATTSSVSQCIAGYVVARVGQNAVADVHCSDSDCSGG
ncbi:hypothetical protein Taro_038076 [Colocasia esculenta]|uniref:Transcription termination factor MTEF18, mitochondrial n=1 Tax=Colocasia esculenta TaxID=4460 RepID=A0A843WER6_COLES|nr:hypothetical protein [Colocasia esculenta]